MLRDDDRCKPYLGQSTARKIKQRFDLCRDICLAQSRPSLEVSIKTQGAVPVTATEVPIARQMDAHRPGQTQPRNGDEGADNPPGSCQANV